MNQRKRTIATGIMIAIFATGLSPAADAWAAGNSEVEELRREVARLRAQAQALQAAIVETTELERQRSANFARAIKQDAPPPQPAALPSAPAPTSEAPAETRAPAAPAAPSAGGDEKRRGKSRQRRHRRAGRAHSKSPRLQADAADR